MNTFEYAAPETLDGVFALLSPAAGECEVLAGGTDLVTTLKQNLLQPKRVVSLKRIAELKGIRQEGDWFHVGAMTTLAEVCEHEPLARAFPSLTQAIAGVGSPQTINVGTIGGDLCQRPRCWYYRQGLGLLAMQDDKSLVAEGDNRYHAVFGNEGPAKFVNASALAPALIALGATVTLAGPEKQTRELPLTDLFRTPSKPGEGCTTLAPTEVVTRVSIPAAPQLNATYEVRPRMGMDWPLVTASVAFTYASGQVRNPRVVLGHVAPIPWNAAAASKALDGKTIDAAVAAACGEEAAKGAAPLSGNGYKVQLIKVAVKRAVLLAAGA